MKQDENSKQPKREPLKTGGLSFRQKMSIYLDLRYKAQMKLRKEQEAKLAEGQPKSNNP